MVEPDDTTSDDAPPPDATSPEATSVLAREAAVRDEVSRAALARYAHRLRRQRLIYFPVVGAIAIALIVTFVVAYLHGEVHNTRLVTVAKAPTSLSVQSPAASQREMWHTGDRAAVGDPQYGGTVVVWGGRTVRGLDARTGRQTWSYYRSDRTVCSVAQIGGITVASYELAGNCDEITALDSGTGTYEWTRTLDLNGQPEYGHPTIQADVADSSLLITTPTVVYSINVSAPPYGGEDHFTYSHFGCRINGAVLGYQGALISQTCSNPRCGSGTSRLKFCGTGPQLLLRGDPDTDYNNKITDNPNMIQWNDFGNTDVPLSTGTLIAAGNTTTGDVDALDATSGTSDGSTSVGVAGSAWATATSAPFGQDDVLLWAGGRLAAVNSNGKAIWTSSSPGPATADGGTLVVPTTSGVRLLSPDTGRTTSSYPLSPAPPAGSTVERLGAGFLVSSTSGTVAYG